MMLENKVALVTRGTLDIGTTALAPPNQRQRDRGSWRKSGVLSKLIRAGSEQTTAVQYLTMLGGSCSW